MKRSILILICLCFGFANSQNRISINAATTVLGFPSIGFEKPIAKHFSFHLDAIGSTFNQYHNKPLKFLIITPEFRYYTKSGQSGFYVGAHIGGSTFHLQKYGYENTNKYQKGFNYMAGVSIGYVYFVTDKIALEAFVGGGTVQSFYKGYDGDTGIRYETIKNYNKSGEWLPYRGGLNVIMKL